MRVAIPVAALMLAGAVSAAGVGPKWTWEAGKQTNNGAVTIKSTSGSTTYSGTQNPTGSAVKTNQSAVTQPPTVIITAGSNSTISGAIQLNNGYVYVYDTGYATWIMLPNATFIANYNKTVDSLNSNVWTTWVDPYFAAASPVNYSYNLKCSPPSATGTNMNTWWSPTGGGNISIGGGEYIVSSAPLTATGSVYLLFAGVSSYWPWPTIAQAQYYAYTTVSYTLWGVSVGTSNTMNGASTSYYDCGTSPSTDFTYNGSFTAQILGGGGLLSKTASPDTTWAMMCLEGDGGAHTCKVFNQSKSAIYTMSSASATPVWNATSGKSYFSAGGQMFFISGPTLYSVNYKTDTVTTLGNIGSALPTAAYINVAHK